VTVVPLTFLDPLLQRGELLGCHRALFEKREGELRSSSATDWFNSYSYSGRPWFIPVPRPRGLALQENSCNCIRDLDFESRLNPPD
jgi:hypothetical protein